VRALRRCDDAPIRELFEHLSAQSRYFRFLSPLQYLPDALVRGLASVDYRRHLALVAYHAASGSPLPIGLGGFDATGDDSAEVALVVRDDWQRRRIGTELAIRVLDAAEARGFHRFVANVAGENFAIRKVIRKLGRIVSSTTSRGTSELVFVRQRTQELFQNRGVTNRES
jgi:acetyltransferase